MKLRSIFCTSAVAAALCVIAAGCGGDSSGDSGNTPPKRGGSITILHYEPVATTLNRLGEVLLGGIWPVSQINENLTIADRKGKIVPVLATSWTTSSDGLTWKFKLRPNVKFSDGKDMTSADVVYSIKQAQRKDAVYRFLFTGIQSATADGPLGVTFKLSKPDPFLPGALANYTATIVPDKLGGKSDDEFNQHPIGTGPFMIGKSPKWVRGSEITLDRNPSYWQKGKPYLDKVTFKYVADENQRTLQLKGGQADVITFAGPTRNTVSLGSTPNVELWNQDGYNQLYFVIGGKSSSEPLRDAGVRRALVMALDREQLTKSGAFGFGKAGTTFLNDKLPGYAPDAGLKFDVNAAKAELAKTKWSNGFTATLYTSPGQEIYTQIMQDSLKKIGVNAKLQSIDDGARLDAELSGKFDMALQPYAMVSASPTELFGAVNDPAVVASMFSGFSDLKLRDQAAVAVSEVDETKRNELFAEVQKAQAQQAFANVLSYVPNPFGIKKSVQGFDVGVGQNMILENTNVR